MGMVMICDDLRRSAVVVLYLFANVRCHHRFSTMTTTPTRHTTTTNVGAPATSLPGTMASTPSTPTIQLTLEERTTPVIFILNHHGSRREGRRVMMTDAEMLEFGIQPNQTLRFTFWDDEHNVNCDAINIAAAAA